MTEQRLVKCVKFGQELPALEKPPFAGDIGKLIFEKVSAQAWKIWKDEMQIKVLNEYRLNLADKNDYNTLVQQMLNFLNLAEGSVAEVENKERGTKLS